ncbi:MAG: hypothetical protein J7L07_01935 [Candidatus Odinarchaeota archaeon]|nr:hypothetical protein [Candidatus Odinarchaeota archaeon]
MPPKIEYYDFGRIVIDGKEYNHDVIIFPDKVKADWWRKEGHRLYLIDIEDVLNYRPEVLIVGTGYHGILKVSDEVRNKLKELGIELMVLKTSEAVKKYNEIAEKTKVVAALHLTC